MHVAELWRYPVKSLRGEPLREAEVRPDGIAGDRLVQVVDPDGELITARVRPDLLGLQASLSADGQPLVDGHLWTDAEAVELVRRATRNGSQLVDAVDRERRFDESPLMVVTEGAAEAFGADRRRFRPNVVIAGVEGFGERSWPEGAVLRAGEVEIRLGHLCERCVMTTFDPDTLEQDAGVLRRINEELDRRFAWNSWVARPGRIAVGDPVELVDQQPGAGN
ncbi:MAG: MOSC domain-containing protein [Thermoleophilaceae bacterium]